MINYVLIVSWEKLLHHNIKLKTLGEKINPRDIEKTKRCSTHKCIQTEMYVNLLMASVKKIMAN